MWGITLAENDHFDKKKKKVGEFISSFGECIRYASKYDIVMLRCRKLRRRLERDRTELWKVGG